MAAITVSDAWVRGTVKGQTTTGAFMTLRSTQALQLIAVSSNVARSSELHRMNVDHGMMRMRPVHAIAIPAGSAVKLGAGGYHIMLIGLRRPLIVGETVPLTLSFRGASGRDAKLNVEARVRPLASDD